MDLKKATGGITPDRLNGLDSSSLFPNGSPNKSGQQSGPSFKETLQGLNQAGLQNSTIQSAGGINGAQNLDGVKFSQHAVDRMRTRGVRFSPEDLGRINEAVSKAAAKGSKDSLILMDNSALIVSVKNKTVVTVMDKEALKENVFTNIDSTIVM